MKTESVQSSAQLLQGFADNEASRDGDGGRKEGGGGSQESRRGMNAAQWRRTSQIVCATVAHKNAQFQMAVPVRFCKSNILRNEVYKKRNDINNNK